MLVTTDSKNPYADVMDEIRNKKEGARYDTFRQCKKQAEAELYESGEWDTMSEEGFYRFMFHMAKEDMRYIKVRRWDVKTFPVTVCYGSETVETFGCHEYVLFDCDLFTPTGKKPTTKELYKDMMTYERFDAFLTEDTLNSICEDVLGEILTYL